ncbi:MAG: trypsin-like peptidase domain-containing protein [Planctomycetota bacterium]
MTDFRSFEPRRPSALPLLIAGAAFVLAVATMLDRMGWFQGAPAPEPRPVAPRGDLTELEQTTTRVFEENAPSVVHITTERLIRTYIGGFFGIARQPEGSGTGFLWDSNGTVVTNYHVVKTVVEAKSRVKVAIGEDYYDADVIGTAREHDIAVLRVIGAPHGLRPITFGTSRDLKVGQFVLAIGNPFGFDRSLSTGIISALDRSIRTEEGKLTGVIQTDAAINPGNSGGPLLDSAGRLIGMNTAIYSPSGASAGIGFAVPVDTINDVVPQLLDGTRGQRSLGLSFYEPIRLRGTRWGYGLPVAGVEPGSGAEKAGIRPFEVDQDGYILSHGDILVAVDGRRVATEEQIRALLRGRRRGEPAKVILLRGEEWREATVEVPLL